MVCHDSDVFILIKNKEELKIVEWSNKLNILNLIESEANNTLQHHQDGLEILKTLKTKYVDPLFESFSMKPPKIAMSTTNLLNSSSHDFLFHVLNVLKHKVCNMTHKILQLGKKKRVFCVRSKQTNYIQFQSQDNLGKGVGIEMRMREAKESNGYSGLLEILKWRVVG